MSEFYPMMIPFVIVVVCVFFVIWIFNWWNERRMIQLVEKKFTLLLKQAYAEDALLGSKKVLLKQQAGFKIKPALSETQSHDEQEKVNVQPDRYKNNQAHVHHTNNLIAERVSIDASYSEMLEMLDKKSSLRKK